MPENCTVNGPLYGHPNVQSIRVADAPDLIIDDRLNPNPDPDSDGIDFPRMNQYVFHIRMRPYIFLQYVNVPASNVILLFVTVHYDSGKGHRYYHSKIQQNPVVENFHTDEPTRYFEVHLNMTDDGQPPDDVTLDVVSCMHRRLSIIVRNDLGLLYSTEK